MRIRGNRAIFFIVAALAIVGGILSESLIPTIGGVLLLLIGIVSLFLSNTRR